MRPVAVALAAATLLAACATVGPKAPGPNAPAAGASASNASAPAQAGAEAGPSIVDLLRAPQGQGKTAAQGTAEPSAAPAPRKAPPVPRIYMALQPGASGRPHSVIFAIDASRDGTPSDDPAIRLSPQNGHCNPQQMRHYDFPAGAKPVVSEAEQARGLTVTDLPNYLAATVTQRMIEARLAATPEDTRPQNVCTRKLWERLVLARNQSRVAGAK